MNVHFNFQISFHSDVQHFCLWVTLSEMSILISES